MNVEEYADLLVNRSNVPADALEALAEYAEIAIFNICLTTGEIQLNHMTTKLTGYEPGELPETENTKIMLTYEEDRPIVSEAMGLLMSGKTDRFYIEYRMKRKDGTLVSVCENCLVLERDKNGTPTRICGLAKDLSRLRWAEEKTRRMERENKRFVEASEFKEVSGRNRMLNATNSAATIIIGGYHQDYEVVLRQALQIIADSIEADKAYILRNMTIDDKLCFYSRAVWDKNAVLGTSYNRKVMAYDDIFPNWRKDFDDQFSVRSRVEDLPSPLNELPWLSGALSVMFVPLYLQGDFFGVLGFEDHTRGNVFTQDEADVMRAGALVIAASIARHETLEQLNKDREAAISGTKAKAEFLSRMSHEIRTPINAIIGMTTLAKRNKDPENLSYYLDMIDGSSKQLLALINDILDMSKIDAGKLEIVRESFDFEEMINSVIHMMRIKTSEKKQNLIVDIGTDFSHEMIGDSLRLSQVLINLLNNASKFTPEEGMITVSVSEKREQLPDDSDSILPWLHISVADTGIGIGEEKQKNLFQAFEQADGSITRNYGGSGLGLSICKKIINLMGGDIWVISKENEGSNFIFEIPIVWGDETNRKKPSAGETQETTSGVPDWRGYTILLAEDIEINREIVVSLLEETGVDIIMAADGEEALALFTNDPNLYDIILMDMQMPNMDGLSATRAIRGLDDPAAQKIPILAMTANAFKEDIDACLNSGMNAHIAKPIDLNGLIATISQYIKRK